MTASTEPTRTDDWRDALVRLKGQPIEGHDRIGTVHSVNGDWVVVAGQFTRCEPQTFPMSDLERIRIEVLPTPTSTELIAPTDIATLRDLMMRWLRGERSHWNEFNGFEGDRAAVVAMCAVADAQEVVKLSAAIQALKGVAVTSTEPPVCHNPSCPISLFEHKEGHGECVPAPAPTALPGAVTPSPETWFMVRPNGSVLQGSANGWVPVYTSVLEKHLTDTSRSEGLRL